jgi:hypothetical protein
MEPTAAKLLRLSPGAERMQRLRERRKKSSALITLEITGEDRVYLRLAGFLRIGDNTSRHLHDAVRRLLDTIR